MPQMKIWLFFLILIVCFFCRVPVAEARSELLPAGKTIQSDYIKTGEQVQIDGTIEGDAFLAGGLVRVNGNIDGDLFVLGGKVSVNGTVGNSVRIVGGDVVLNGEVGRNALLICASCVVTKEASVSGSLLVAGGNGEVSAPVIGKGFRYFGGRLYLDSPINNEAFVVANQDFILGPRASISGDLKYSGKNQAVISKGATVAGRISYESLDRNESFPGFFGARGYIDLFEKIRPLVDFGGFIVSVFLGVIFLGLFPKYFEKTAVAIEKQAVASFGWGLLAIVIGPLIMILLAITIIGIPVSLLLVLVGYIAFMASQFVMAFVIGRKILLKKAGERRGWAITLGLLIFYLVGLIPIIGRVFYLSLIVLGLGGMIISYRHKEIVGAKVRTTK